MFVDRTELVSLLDQLVLVRGGDQVRANDNRPVLVVEGSGGSGRSAFVRAMWNRWARRTPTAWVDPRLIGEPDAQEMRAVLLAVLLGLSRDVPGYRVRFSRVITAYIAMKEPITDEDPEKAAEIMLRRLVAYRDKHNLIDLVGGLVRVAGDAVRAVRPGDPGAEVAPAISQEIAPRIVDRIQRSRIPIKGKLDKAVEWFGHQDTGLNFDPLAALVRLSGQAVIKTKAVRQQVDELLVTALLADLRESLEGVENRPSHALILLDNGDMPMARAFTTALVRVQGRVPDPMVGHTARPLDPVVVMTASGGVLVEDLLRSNALPVRWEGSRSGRGILPSGQRYGTWLPVQLSDFTEADVQTMALKRMWPPTLGNSTISRLTYRLTGGHADATTLVLRVLESTPAQLNNLHQVLRDRSFTAGTPLEDHLLDKIVGGLRASGTVDTALRHDLVTLAAARDVREAESLTELLQAPTQELLLTSRTLWSGHPTALPPLEPPPSTSPLLSPLVRYLGLRELAGRTEDDGPTWDRVFGALRDSATAAGKSDRAARLHHELALGNRALVVAEFIELLPTVVDEEWLTLLDQVTATPDPRWRFTIPKRAPAPSTGHAEVIARLVEGQHAASDPQLGDPETLNHLYNTLSNDFGHLAGNSRVFLQRAAYYADLAGAFS